MNMQKSKYIIAIIGLAIIGFLFFQSHQKYSELDEKYEELSFPDNTLDTSDWQIHQVSRFNKNIAAEIRYPRNWKIQSHRENQKGPKASMVVYDRRMGHGADNGIYMMVEKIPIKDYLRKSKKFSEYRKIKVNNAYGYALPYKTKNGFLATSVKLSNIKEDRTYTFFIIGSDSENPADPGKYLNTLEQILLSFRLTN